MAVIKPSFLVTVLNLIYIILTLSALFSEQWLEVSLINQLYPYTRIWGLFRIYGRTTRSHQKTRAVICQAYAEDSAFGTMCTTVYCQWLGDKCNSWTMLLGVSYFVVAALLFMAAVVLSTTIFQFANRTSIKKKSMAIMFITFIVNLLVLTVYLVVANIAFTTVNAHGYYPFPEVGLSYYLACAAVVILLISILNLFGEIRDREKEAKFISQVRNDVEQIQALTVNR